MDNPSSSIAQPTTNKVSQTSATNDPPSSESDIGTNSGPKMPYYVTGYHVGMLVLAAVITLLTYQGKITGDDALKKALYTVCFGAAGGLLTASRYVVYSVRHSIYDPRRLLWQLVSPIHSAILAGVFIVTVKGGLFALGQPLAPEEPKHTLAIMGFSFFVGLASESFVKKLIVAIEALFGERGDLAPETTQGVVVSEVVKPEEGKGHESSDS
jgi:hypothetical protein